MSVNVVILGGNAGKDCQLKHTPGGFAIGEFSLAVSKKEKNGYTTSWVRVKLLGRYAEVMSPLVKQGARVIVDGELKVSEYTSRDGQAKTYVEVLANSITLIDGVAKPTQSTEYPDDPIDDLSL